MRTSEIFNNFVKIAEEKGFTQPIQKTAQMQSSKMNAKDIEKLYNLKPDAPKDMEYDKNIMQDAHPDSVIISPSYDKINGLVENNNERQNIILNIVNRNNNGQLTNHKYAAYKNAEKDLTLNLVRLANELDNKNNQSLMSLADRCLSDISKKKLKKEAIGPWAIAGIAAAVSILAGMYWHQHAEDIDEGLSENYSKLNSAVIKLISSDTESIISGYKLRPEFISRMKTFKSKLDGVNTRIKSFLGTAYDHSASVEDLSALKRVSTAKNNEKDKEFKIIQVRIKSLLRMAEKIKTDFAQKEFQQFQIMRSDSGFVTNLIDYTQFMRGGYGVVSNIFDRVLQTLPTYMKSLETAMSTIESSFSQAKAAVQEMTAENDGDDELETPAVPPKKKTKVASYIY